ncbi:hypothetical protein ES703_10468 [subsurface metagenome]
MDKKNTLAEIMIYIEQAKNADRFKGRASLLKVLDSFYDHVDLHKFNEKFNALCLSQVHKLMKRFQEDLNVGK